MLAFLGFSIHSGAVQFHKNLGYVEFERYQAAIASGSSGASELAASSLEHLLWCDRWGLMSTPRLEERLAALFLAREGYGSAETHLRRVVKRSPSDAGARTDLALCLIRAGRPDEAEEQLRQALRVRSITRAGSVHLTAVQSRAHYYLAEVQAATGRPTEAESSLREALRLKPEFAEAHYSLGVLALETGQLDTSAKHLREAIHYKPGMAEAHYNLAVTLFSQSRLQEAIAETERALALNPSDPQAQAFLVHLNQQMGSQSR
jgi:Flp pilus assembly protein TadD